MTGISPLSEMSDTCYWWGNTYGSVTQYYVAILEQLNFGRKISSLNCED